MTAAQWTVIGIEVANVLATVGLIGRERKPITPGTAVASLFIAAGLIAVALFA